jgi:hypothetical protein
MIGIRRLVLALGMVLGLRGESYSQATFTSEVSMLVEKPGTVTFASIPYGHDVLKVEVRLPESGAKGLDSTARELSAFVEFSLEGINFRRFDKTIKNLGEHYFAVNNAKRVRVQVRTLHGGPIEVAFSTSAGTP